MFIATVGIAVTRTKSSASGLSPSVFINVEAYSITFSAQYFYIISTFILGSIIGVSQTESPILQLLNSFCQQVQNAFPQWNSELSSRYLTSDSLLQKRKGGLYSWQTRKAREEVQQNIKWKGRGATNTPTTFWNRIHQQLAGLLSIQPGSQTLLHIIIASSAFTGMLITCFVPPMGWEFRHIWILLICVVWGLSSLLDLAPCPQHHGKLYSCFILIKDVIAASATMGGLAATQVGVFNRCSCYTLWGRTSLALPEGSTEAAFLMRRIETVYSAIAFLWCKVSAGCCYGFCGETV